MIISKDIPLDVNKVIQAIYKRQSLPWNNGRINDYYESEILQKMFEYMNSGIPKEDYFYQGNLFRIHGSHSTLQSCVDTNRERIIENICDDGSCSVLPITEYSEKPVAFSMNHDFTRRCFYKVSAHSQAVMFYCDTGTSYGLDVNMFLKRYNARNEMYEEEQEVLFPLLKEYVVKEYHCTPTQFNYYLRNL